MAAHGVDLANVGATAQQGAGNGLFVGQADAGHGQRQQGRAAARDQAQDHIIGAQTLHHLQHAFGGLHPGFVGHGVGGLHDFNVFAIHRMPIAGDDQATHGTRRMQLHRTRHRRAGLACTHHDQTAFGRGRNERRHAHLRLGRGHGRVKGLAQQVHHRIAHWALHLKGA